jgi:DNA topoisomerase III
MIVVVAEKPSVGRDIARVLKCSKRGEGYLSGAQYTVTWAVGHLVTLCEPDEIDEKYKKWRMDDLPILPATLPTKVIPKTKAQYGIIKKLICEAETVRVICATDAGREGELIFRLIYEKSKCSKPVDRLWISSMTDEAIRDGFASLKPSAEYDGLFHSASCRSQADWLVGMNASRAFTLRYNTLLSIGRVQTPTLAILVKRHLEIAGFVPQEYYTVTADFGDYTGLWFNEAEKDEKTNSRIPDKEKAEEIVQAVRGRQACIRSVTREEKREFPPQLYDLTSLQRDANRILGFTAQKTLKIAQELYEKWKCLTYPRTDSKCLPVDMIARTWQTLQNLPPEYRVHVEGIKLHEGKLPFSKRIFDNAKVTDHHAIIPTTKAPDVEKMPTDERKLFDMVTKRLIAAFYPAYEYDLVRILTDAGGHAFKSTGRTVRVPGWKTVFIDDRKEDETSLPNALPGDMRPVNKVSSKKESTKPPAPHTDASLLAAMEHAGREIEDETLREQMKEGGLGTPATRAAIIERLISVGYAIRHGRALNAAEKGVQLISVVPADIASPEMTGKWELALEEIAHTNLDTGKFMGGIREFAASLVAYARGQADKAVFPEERRGKVRMVKASAPAKNLEESVCPLCGKPVQETEKAFGCSGWRDGCHFTLWKNSMQRGGGPVLDAQIMKILLATGEVKGSTGILRIKEGMLEFTPDGTAAAPYHVSVKYEKRK